MPHQSSPKPDEGMERARMFALDPQIIASVASKNGVDADLVREAMILARESATQRRRTGFAEALSDLISGDGDRR